MTTKVCLWCGKEYVYHGHKSGDHTKYCSDDCCAAMLAERSRQNFYKHGRAKQKAKYNADAKRADWLMNSVPEGFTYLNDWKPGKACASFMCNKHRTVLVRDLTAILRNASKSIKCPECRREWDNLYRNERRIHPGHLIDRNITVRKLFKRDSGICYLCGGLCDWSDKQRREDGVMIYGSKYPSIDHVIPLSKNGFHSWENVRLAHLRCNRQKSNKLLVASQERI